MLHDNYTFQFSMLQFQILQNSKFRNITFSCVIVHFNFQCYNFKFYKIQNFSNITFSGFIQIIILQWSCNLCSPQQVLYKFKIMYKFLDKNSYICIAYNKGKKLMIGLTIWLFKYLRIPRELRIYSSYSIWYSKRYFNYAI